MIQTITQKCKVVHSWPIFQKFTIMNAFKVHGSFTVEVIVYIQTERQKP